MGEHLNFVKVWARSERGGVFGYGSATRKTGSVSSREGGAPSAGTWSLQAGWAANLHRVRSLARAVSKGDQ